MVEVGAPISLDGMAVHPCCWCICLCYLHFAPENPDDGEMYLLVLAHLGCPGQSPQSHKMVVCVVCYISRICPEAPPPGICTRFGIAVGVANTITCDNFLAIS